MKNADKIYEKLREAAYLIGQAERMVAEDNPWMLAFAIGGAHGLLLRLAIDEFGHNPDEQKGG